jgi:hypothetical protein
MATESQSERRILMLLNADLIAAATESRPSVHTFAPIFLNKMQKMVAMATAKVTNDRFFREFLSQKARYHDRKRCE